MVPQTEEVLGRNQSLRLAPLKIQGIHLHLLSPHLNLRKFRSGHYSQCLDLIISAQFKVQVLAISKQEFHEFFVA
jgi:hypothetical protein